MYTRSVHSPLYRFEKQPSKYRKKNRDKEVPKNPKGAVWIMCSGKRNKKKVNKRRSDNIGLIIYDRFEFREVFAMTCNIYARSIPKSDVMRF